MDPFTIGLLVAGVVTAVSSIATGIGNAVSTSEANKQNVALQEEAWNKNSYQSRVADAEKAGISKWLVAGGTPSYSLNTSVKSQDFSGISSGVGKLFDTASALAPTENMIQQTKNAKMQYENLQSQKDLLDSQARGQNIKNMMSAWDFLKYQERGIASNDTSAIKNWTALASVLGIDQPGKKGSVEEFFKKVLGGNDLSVLGTKPQELPKKPKLEGKSKSVKIFNDLKKDYQDAWRSDANSYMPIKVNKHYK